MRLNAEQKRMLDELGEIVVGGRLIKRAEKRTKPAAVPQEPAAEAAEQEMTDDSL